MVGQVENAEPHANLAVSENATQQRQPHTFGDLQIHESSASAPALVSWNIAGGVRLVEIVEALRGPLAADLYLLQEVDLHTRRAGCRNVAEEIARELKLNYVFGIEFQELAQDGCGRTAFHGQALLSRFPISRTRVLRFRHQLYNWGPRWKGWLRRLPLLRWSWLQPRRGGRMALVAEIQYGGRPWVIYNIHLESKTNDAGRAQQIREILDDVSAHYPPDIPVVVAGDLNTRQGEESPVLQILKAGGFQDVLEDHQGPRRTKVRSHGTPDWIFLRELQSFDARILPLEISDYYPLKVCLAGRADRARECAARMW